VDRGGIGSRRGVDFEPAAFPRVENLDAFQWKEIFRDQNLDDLGAAARLLFEASLNRQLEDELVAKDLARCRILLENPPGEPGNGVFGMTK